MFRCRRPPLQAPRLWDEVSSVLALPCYCRGGGEDRDGEGAEGTSATGSKELCPAARAAA